MHGVGNLARLRNLARHMMNTIADVLSMRKDELPKDLRDEAVISECIGWFAELIRWRHYCVEIQDVLCKISGIKYSELEATIRFV